MSANATAPPAQDVAPRLRLVVSRIARLLRQHVDHAPNTELPTSLISALATLERAGAVTLGELATAERVQPPSMTRIVAKLSERGLVVRTIDARDRRIARVALSAEGRRVLAHSRSRKNAYLAQHLRYLDPDELGALSAALPVLERIAEGLG